jgi:hypothetical protein
MMFNTFFPSDAGAHLAAAAETVSIPKGFSGEYTQKKQGNKKIGG